MVDRFPGALPLVIVGLAGSLGAQTDLTPREAAKELARLYADDQKDQVEWESSPGRDEEFAARQHERRERVVEILNATELEDPQAWDDAAGLLLHGDVPGDFLLAHLLSIPAGIEGTPFGRFTTAAGLDRFLETTGREQIFGTQFHVERPDQVQYDEYPPHFMPEHLRQLFHAGPPLRVRDPAAKDGSKPPRAKEIHAMAREVARAEPGSVSEELCSRTRAAVFGNEKLKAADLLAAARVLSTSSAADDLLLAHVCAAGAGFEGKKKERKEALAACTRTLDAWLVAAGETPRFEIPAGTTASEPAPPEWLKRLFRGE